MSANLVVGIVMGLAAGVGSTILAVFVLRKRAAAKSDSILFGLVMKMLVLRPEYVMKFGYYPISKHVFQVLEKNFDRVCGAHLHLIEIRAVWQTIRIVNTRSGGAAENHAAG